MYGNTICYSEDFKEIGEYFNNRRREGAGWILSKKREQEVLVLLKDEMHEFYTESPSPATEITPILSSVKCERGQSIAVSLNNCQMLVLQL